MHLSVPLWLHLKQRASLNYLCFLLEIEEGASSFQCLEEVEWAALLVLEYNEQTFAPQAWDEHCLEPGVASCPS